MDVVVGYFIVVFYYYNWLGFLGGCVCSDRRKAFVPMILNVLGSKLGFSSEMVQCLQITLSIK